MSRAGFLGSSPKMTVVGDSSSAATSTLPVSHYAVISATGGFLHDVTTLTSEEVEFNEVIADTDGYAATPNHLIVPAGLGGLYLAQFNIRPATPYGLPTADFLHITAGTDAFLTLAYWKRQFSDFGDVSNSDYLSWSQFAPFSDTDDLYATFDNETDVTLSYYDTNAMASLALYRIDPDYATCEVFRLQDDDDITLSQPYVAGTASVRSTPLDGTDGPMVTWARDAGSPVFTELDPAGGVVSLLTGFTPPLVKVVVCYTPA